MPSSLPERTHPVHGVKRTKSGPTIVFLTVCTRGRIPWLANDLVHEQLRSIWGKSEAWRVGRYVVMPDHVHLFAGLYDERFDLDRWARYWKSQFSKLHKTPEHRWQTDHWDTRMRTVEQFEEKWRYVRLNPVRKGLANDPGDWPYQGVVFDWVW